MPGAPTKSPMVVIDCPNPFLRVEPREIKRVRRRKIRPVEQVENFRAELQVELLANPEVLQYGKIHIFETRAVKLVAPHGTERT